MFQKTRYTLTVWYVFITMVVSIIFSSFIYTGISIQIHDFSRMINLQQQSPQLYAQMEGPPFSDLVSVSPDIIIGQFRTILILVNIALLFISACAGYILAGKSLRPVKEMVDEQNRFISDASHELRAPITAIRVELEVALMNEHIGMNAKKVINSSLEGIINLQDLANDLLELNKYEGEKYKIYFTQNSLLDISEQAITRNIFLLKEKHITVDNQFQDIKIYGDKIDLIRLLTILIDNAAKYSKPHKVISLTSENVKERLILKVIDQGIGMNEYDTKHAFDRFYRADMSRSKYSATGYGLGLYIAKLIVKKHSGQISAESIKGKGSVFTISIPNKLSKS